MFEPVVFDVHLKPALAEVDEVPTVATIERFKPPPEAVIRCARWLSEQGVTCRDTGFGLACSAPQGRFEALFTVSLLWRPPSVSNSPWLMHGVPQAPQEIADVVADITLTGLPELF